MRYRHHARRPAPIGRFVRLGMPDVGRSAPPDPVVWRRSARALATTLVFYALIVLATGACLFGLGLVRLP